MRAILVSAFILFSIISLGQEVKILNLDKPNVNFRGLSVVDNYVFWVSGNQGTIGYSLNGAKTFIWVNPPGFEDRDFRDIEALDYKTALAIAIGEPAVILKTTDNGKNWKVVYEDDQKGVFLDDISFSISNPQNGIVLGDPINGEPYILTTQDAGETWTKMPASEIPDFKEGEAFFAASGSNSYAFDFNSFFMVTGGSQSSLKVKSIQNHSVSLPKTDSQTSGANGMDYSYKGGFGMIAGGDFEKPYSSENNLFLFQWVPNQAPTISQPQTPPTGYKSGVAILDSKKAISCGLMGVDFSDDQGKNWKLITSIPFNTCKQGKIGNKVYLVGPQGRIGHLVQN